MAIEYRQANGWDPFEGTSALADVDRRAIGVYLRLVADTLGLRDWEVRVSEGSPDSKTSIAESFMRDSSPESIVAIADKFFDWPERARRKTLIHEVLHAAIHPLSKFARNAVDGELGRRWEVLFEEQIGEHEELLIDRLAAALVELLPPSPERADAA